MRHFSEERDKSRSLYAQARSMLIQKFGDDIFDYISISMYRRKSGVDYYDDDLPNVNKYKKFKVIIICDNCGVKMNQSHKRLKSIPGKVRMICTNCEFEGWKCY